MTIEGRREQDQTLAIAIPRPLDRLYTYRLPGEWADLVKIGGWVKVPFGRGISHGFIVESPKPLGEWKEDFPVEKLKKIIEVNAGGPALPQDVYDLCIWAAKYYQNPLGEVLNAATPSAVLGLGRVKSEAKPLVRKTFEPRRIDLTAEQGAALEAIQSKDGVFLLDGVTGSGKTEVYIEAAKQELKLNRGVILLVPEIALTPQLHDRFEKGLGESVALWHSAVSAGKRRDQFAALRSGELRVVVGARSAIFAPVKDLGLIVVDEEHDATYKQEDRVRYQARDLAIVRGKEVGAKVILGSATPSIESQVRTEEGRYTRIELKQRIAKGGMPLVDIVDLSKEKTVYGSQAVIAKRTIEELQRTLDRGEQAMVFLNRRGFAAFLLCEDCNAVEECPDCSISLTVHKRARQLKCHLCGFSKPHPKNCSQCQSHRLNQIGAGTESLEEELPQLLNGANLLRLDRDQMTSVKRVTETLEAFRRGDANVLLGTQMLVKGHDFPNVTLVVVILADALLSWPDFRASERAYQILTQVAGRAGRGEKSGRVLIQTYQPEHPVISVLTAEKAEEEFFLDERELRKLAGYPPYRRLARLRIENEKEDRARQRAMALAEGLRQLKGDVGGLEVLGPTEAFVVKAKGIYRWDILIKGEKVQDVHRAVFGARAFARERNWQVLVDVDPNGVG